MELESNPKAALVFFWSELEQSVRIEGKKLTYTINCTGIAEKIPEKESEEYFHSRPRASQIGAWASPNQSSKVEDREEIDKRYKVRSYDFDQPFRNVKKNSKM